MTRWFRHYTGMMRDPKLVGIAARTGQAIERVAFVWGCILEDASEAQAKGAYTLDIDEIAYFLRCAPDDIAAIHIELSKVGLVTEGIVIKWCERQYVTEVKDPGNAERQRRFKAKRRAEKGLETVTGNGEVTAEKRPETETETDISLPKGRDKPTPRAELLSVLDEAHADAVIAHRRGLNAKLSPHAASLLAKRLSECSDPNAAADLMIERGWKGIKPEWFEREQTAKLIPFNRKPAGAQNGVREATDILRDTAAQLRAEGATGFGDGAYSHDARFLPRPG